MKKTQICTPFIIKKNKHPRLGLSVWKKPKIK